jgi:hypothetical protein
LDNFIFQIMASRVNGLTFLTIYGKNLHTWRNVITSHDKYNIHHKPNKSCLGENFPTWSLQWKENPSLFFSGYLGEWSDRAKNLSLPPYFHKQNYQTHGGHI